VITNFFFYLVIFLFSFGQLGRVSLEHGLINFYVYEIFLVMFFINLFFKFKFKPLISFFKTEKTLFVFFAWTILTYFISLFYFTGTENLIALLYLLKIIFYGAFYLYLSSYLKHNKGGETVLRRGVIIFAVFTALSSGVQYLFYPDLRNLIYSGWDPHLNRLFGVFFDTSLAAAIYGLVFLYFYKRKKIIFSVIFITLFILTFSRSAYVMLLFTILFDIFRKKNIKFGILILILFFAIFAFVPKRFGIGVDLTRTFSVSSRVADYQKAILIWQKSPVIGHGYNHIQFIKEKMNLLGRSSDLPFHSEASFSSSYMIVLVTTGIVGIILFLLSLKKIILDNKKSFIYVMFICLLSLVDNIILHPFILFLMGVIILSDN